MLAARPHAGDEQETGVVEDGAFALRHRVETAGEIGELTAKVARDPFISIGLVIVRSTMMRSPNVKEGIEKAGEIAAEQQSGDARLIRLNTESDDVAH